MNIELSPSQERRLHSILDRGLEAIHENNDSFRASPSISELNLSNSSHTTANQLQIPPAAPEKSNKINSELKELQEKLAFFEARLTKNAENFIQTSKRKNHSPASSFKQASNTSSRDSSRLKPNKRSETRERKRSIENSEKEINRIERSITPSPCKKKDLNGGRQIGKIRDLVEKERKVGERLRKENEKLRKELGKRDELKESIGKLQEEYNELALAFERSEAVRKKQKELIEQLKNEIKILGLKTDVEHKVGKGRKSKRNI